MVRHSIIVYRDDEETCRQHIAFSGTAWLSYIPIRIANTICIQDHVPPGAAVVLINQAHTYVDLLLPIGPTEKVWFDAIDGVRSIGQIIESTPSANCQATSLEVARTFFERLWWHDQAVFDASASASAIVHRDAAEACGQRIALPSGA